MRDIPELLFRLEGLLDRLAEPERLDGEDVGEVMAQWDEDMAALEALTAKFPDGVTPGDGTRERLTRFVKRIAEVQPELVKHKSEVADQLFAENRRMQSLRRGYGVMAADAGFWRQKA
ncbi:MAG: hypothetical protein HQM03_07490 [Magnetococcales bacterium]|nr:hypothetical protein [Magnetococcales bacterium]